MIDQALYRSVVALDRREHRRLRMEPLSDLSVTRDMHGVFIAVAEFGEACKEYPVVYARVGKDEQGRDEIAPMAVLGFDRGENLYLKGSRWDVRYVPAFVLRYPFAMSRVDEQRSVVCIDREWAGWTEADADDAAAPGRALFDASGEPTPFLQETRRFLDGFEAETERTRLFGALLRDLGLLEDKRFEATLPGGETLLFEGFLAVNEERLKALPDATVLELHRNGVLAQLALQHASLTNMQRLVERRIEARAAAAH